jgi:uncharacterized protein
MTRHPRDSRWRCAALALAIVAGLALGAGPPARAVEPGLRHAMTPEQLGLQAEDITFTTADSATISGWWFPGVKGAPVIVVASRGTGTMGDLLPCVQQLMARRYHVLTFDYRGFGPGASPETVDDLRYVVFDSRWVEDLVGALRYARTRAGGRVFAWGQDLGSAVALAAAARTRGTCDAVAVEGLFRSAEEVLNANGTSAMQDVVVRHRMQVEGRDEPFSAAARLRVPLFVVLAEKDDVTPPAVTREICARVRTGVAYYAIPGAKHLGAEKTPGYFDRLTQWFKLYGAVPPAGAR